MTSSHEKDRADVPPVLRFARSLGEALDRVHTLEPAFMNVEDKAAAVAELARQRARLEALELKVLAAADRDDVKAATGATSTGAWLSRATGCDRAEAARQVALARALDGPFAHTGAALAAGELSTAHARVIVAAVEDLPVDLDPHLRSVAEKTLVQEAETLTPRELRLAGQHILEVLCPDEAERRLKDKLDADDARAWARCRFTSREHADGTTSGRFRLPTVTFRVLKALLEAMMAPRKQSRATSNGATRSDGSSADATGADADFTEPVEDGSARFEDHATRMGKAFAQLVEHFPSETVGEHGGVAATIVVTTTVEALRELVGHATLPDGTMLGPGQLRRLACNAGLIPAVLGGPSVLLDLGREARLASRAQRIALAVRDGGCRAEGCDRPATWCEAHHLDPWSTGGRTDLARLVLLCAHHHHLAHDSGYRITVTPERRVVFSQSR